MGFCDKEQLVGGGRGMCPSGSIREEDQYRYISRDLLQETGLHSGGPWLRKSKTHRAACWEEQADTLDMDLNG